MAVTLTANWLPPCERTLWRYGLISSLIALLGACGMVDYTTHSENFFAPASKNKDIGVITFHYSDGSDPYDVRVRRVKGGYAMQAPVFEYDDGSTMRVVASKTKEKATFIGVEGRLTF